MNAFKTILLYVFGGALLGDLVGTLLGRSSIPWWHSSGSATDLVQVHMPEKAQLIISQMLTFQLIGGGVGAVLGLILGVMVVRAFARRAAGRVPPPVAPPPAGTKP